MMSPLRSILIMALAWAVISGEGLVYAQPAASKSGQGYPDKPIRWVLPYAPGGATEIIARIVAQKLSENLGQQIVIDNRGGGASIVGTEMVARAVPDGYTMLFGTFGFAFTPSLHKDLPYHPVRDFAPVSLIGNGLLTLVVHPSLPVNSVKELIAMARDKPRQINYGSTGGGSSSSLGALLFRSMTGVQMTEITYKGAGPSTAALLGGEVNLIFSSILPALPHIKSGKIRALGVSSSKRSSVLPNIPTIAEAGVPGYELVSWYGILLPGRTPQPVISKLHQHTLLAVNSAEVQEKLAAQGVEPATSTPSELARYISTEIAKWAKLIKETGARHE
jgi:tripartite-type tricarboxylate transporter receptor subunit TctC